MRIQADQLRPREDELSYVTYKPSSTSIRILIDKRLLICKEGWSTLYRLLHIGISLVKMHRSKFFTCV